MYELYTSMIVHLFQSILLYSADTAGDMVTCAWQGPKQRTGDRLNHVVFENPVFDTWKVSSPRNKAVLMDH